MPKSPELPGLTDSAMDSNNGAESLAIRWCAMNWFSIGDFRAPPGETQADTRPPRRPTEVHWRGEGEALKKAGPLKRRIRPWSSAGSSRASRIYAGPPESRPIGRCMGFSGSPVQALPSRLQANNRPASIYGWRAVVFCSELSDPSHH